MPKLAHECDLVIITCNEFPHLLKMPDRNQVYILGALIIGAGLVISWRSSSGASLHNESAEEYQREIAQLGSIKDTKALKRKLYEIADTLSLGKYDIKEGIEGCIGNTPLIRIKSLSDATGCDILAKAEVRIV